MTEIQAFLTEWEREFASTARVIGNLPPTSLGWRPHPKSRTAGDLVWHLVSSERIAAGSYLAGRMLDEPAPAQPPATLQGMIQAYALQHQDLTGRVRKAPAEAWTRTFPFLDASEVTGAWVLHTMILHHALHHRGQLTVYLRLLDAKVPAVYGPTADDTKPAR